MRGSVRRLTAYVAPMVSYNCPPDTATALPAPVNSNVP